MIRNSKEADERREAGSMECWCLHGAVGMASDWRELTKRLAGSGLGSRAVDLWRFLEDEPEASMSAFGSKLNAEATDEVYRGTGRALMGYSMGGRLALHALLEKDHPWQAAVIISAHPGLDSAEDRQTRRTTDASWASRALLGNWQNFRREWNAQPLLGSGSIREPEAESRLVRHRREIARSFVDWSLGNQESLWPRLGEIEVPVLWVAGENDPKYSELAQRAASLMPRADFLMAPSAGHRVPWESADWLAHQVGRFLGTGGA